MTDGRCDQTTHVHNPLRASGVRKSHAILHCGLPVGHTGEHMMLTSNASMSWDDTPEGCAGILTGLLLVGVFAGLIAHFLLAPLGERALACEKRGGALVLLPLSCVQALKVGSQP